MPRLRLPRNFAQVWLGGLVALFGVCISTPSAASDSAVRIQIDEIQWALSSVASDAAQREAKAQRLPALEAQLALSLRSPEVSEGMRIKSLRFLEFAKFAQQNAEFDERPSVPMLPVTLLGEAGSQCRNAVAFDAGTGLRLSISNGKSVWFRVQLNRARDVLLSTRGSNFDARLSVFADCRLATQEADSVGDDNFGLQAEVGLDGGKQAFWYVRLDNIGTRPGQAVLSAKWVVARIRGVLVRDSDSTLLPFRMVSMFRVNGADAVFASSQYTNSQGLYEFIIGQEGTYAVRTSRSYESGSAEFIPEAFDDKKCFDYRETSLESCGAAGNRFTPIVITTDGTYHANFRLENAATLVGTISTSVDGTPLANASVNIDVGGYSGQSTVYTDETGRYRIPGIISSPVYLRSYSVDHLIQTFNGINCPVPHTCPPITTGEPISMSPGGTRRIDMQLQRSHVLNVSITVTGPPNLNFYGSVALLNLSGQVVGTGNINSGSARIGPVAPGVYKVRATSSTTYGQLYGGVECASDCIGELALGTSITVLPNTASTQISMNLRRLPILSVHLGEDGSNFPIEQASLFLYSSSPYSQIHASRVGEGQYKFSAVPPGTYLLYVASDQHIDEVYNNVVCEDANTNPITVCSGAAPITFNNSSPDRVLEISLARSSSISGRVTGLSGAYPLSNAGFTLLNPSGTAINGVYARTQLNSNDYLIEDVQAGSYRIAVRADSTVPQIYNGINCISAQNGPFTGCNITAAQPVIVQNTSATTGIDFHLIKRGARHVRVVNSLGLPIAGVALDVWNENLTRVTSNLTNANGDAQVGPPPYSSTNTTGYYISTDNELGYRDEVYNNLACPAGSAFYGLCSVAGGALVQFSTNELHPPITIQLEEVGRLFNNGFESRD